MANKYFKKENIVSKIQENGWNLANKFRHRIYAQAHN